MPNNVVDVFNDTDLVINVHQGPPPVDQTALVAQLQADNAALQADKDALTTQVATLTSEIVAAKTDLAKALADLG